MPAIPKVLQIVRQKGCIEVWRQNKSKHECKSHDEIDIAAKVAIELQAIGLAAENECERIIICGVFKNRCCPDSEMIGNQHLVDKREQE